MIKKADIILGIILLILCGTASVFAWNAGDTGAKAVVTVAGELYGEYDLSVDQVINIDVSGHHNQLTIKDGRARMTEADCPDGYCLRQYAADGGINSTNQTIVCLPNKVIVTIEGGKAAKQQDNYDAIVS